MKVIFGINKIRKFKRPVVALGVFDGLHLGHRNILQSAARKAKAIKGTSIVLTFWPHPQKEESLYSLEHRLRLIKDLGIDVCIVINFSKNFARISAGDFIKDILVKKIQADYVYVGRNFRFGKGAQGDLETLKKFSKIYHYRLKAFAVIKIRNKPVSSTCIRALIKKGDLVTAEKLLGRPVSILGTVIRGVSLAGRLGFPTANINPHHEVIPPSGVYAVKAILDHKKLNGICNIGEKIELHIFNFQKNIYGKYLEIQFRKKIRNEKKFLFLSSLANQIKKDIPRAKKILSLH